MNRDLVAILLGLSLLPLGALGAGCGDDASAPAATGCASTACGDIACASCAPECVLTTQAAQTCDAATADLTSDCPQQLSAAHTCVTGKRSCETAPPSVHPAAGEWGSCVYETAAVPNDCYAPTAWSCDGTAAPPTCGVAASAPVASGVQAVAAGEGGAIFTLANDGSLAKRTADGDVAWSVAVSRDLLGASPAPILTSDGQGGVYLAAWWIDKVDVGAVEIDLVAGTSSAFVAHVDASGVADWGTAFSDASLSTSMRDVRVDASGNVRVLVLEEALGDASANHVDLVVLDAGGNEVSHTQRPSAGAAGLGASRLSPLGGAAYVEPASDASACSGLHVELVDADGATTGTFDVPPSSNARVVDAAFDAQGNFTFVATLAADERGAPGSLGTGTEIWRLDPTGAVIWQHHIFGQADLALLAVDDQGSAIVSGTTMGTLALGDATSYAPTNFGSVSYLAKYSKDGDLIWAQHGDDPSSLSLVTLATAPGGDILIVAYSGGKVERLSP